MSSLDATDFIGTGIKPLGIAVDGEHIYWANSAQRTIGRASHDGSAVDLKFIRTVDSPWGVAVDGDHIYWTTEI